MSPGQMSKSRVEAPSAAAEPRLAPQPGLQYLRAKCGTRSSQQAPQSSPAASFDHLISASEECRWDRQANFLGGFEVDDQFEFRRLFNREIGGLGPLGDT